MKSKKIENIVQAEEDNDESSIELKSKEIIDVPTKKERKPYVMTEARKQAFEKAREKRDENIKLRKAQQKQLNDEQEAIKNAVIEKRNRNLIKKNKKEIKKIIQNEDLLSSSSDEEEIIVKKKHPKKKVIYIESESEEEKPNKYNDVRTPTFKKPEPPTQERRRIIQYL
jgi:hypothetical protein